MYQQQRAGLNLNEGTLTTSNVANLSLKARITTVDEAIYAQPLYLPNVCINGNCQTGQTRNVVYVVTEKNSVYAFDADTYSTLWGPVSLTVSGGERVVESNVSCSNFPSGYVGITGTPVIDISMNSGASSGYISSGYLYAVSKSEKPTGCTLSGCTFYQDLYAIDVTTGSIAASTINNSSPHISATVNSISFQPGNNHQRAALLLLNGNVYIGWGSHCDNTPWNGWMMSYQTHQSGTNTLTQSNTWLVTADSNDATKGSIWQGGNGPASDGTNIFVATGNGPFTAPTDSSSWTIDPAPNACNAALYSGCDYSDSIVKLNQSLGVLDWFTPSDKDNRASHGHDYDLGSGGVLVVPHQPSGMYPSDLLMQGGKEGNAFLVSRGTGHMGGYSGLAQTDHVVGAIYGNNMVGNGFCFTQNSSGECGMWSSPAWWGAGNAPNSSTPYTSYLYFGPYGGSILQYKLSPPGGSCGSTACLVNPPVNTTETFGYPGTTPVVSTSSNTSSSAVLWAIDNSTFATLNGHAKLYAWDATSLGTSKFSTSSSLTWPGPAVKFTVPLVVNGKVYVGGYMQLTVYGL